MFILVLNCVRCFIFSRLTFKPLLDLYREAFDSISSNATPILLGGAITCGAV